jgi:hypothetical protein
MPSGDTTGIATSAPVFYECPACGRLSAHPDFRDAKRAACPECRSHAGDRLRTFPSDRLRRLDERIRAYHAAGDHEIVVILAAAFLEAILEDILDRILVEHGADARVRRVVIGGQRSISMRIAHVFPTLTGTEFEDAAAELGYRDFPKRWRTLRDARNAFIHDSPFHGARESLDRRMSHEAMTLLDQAYRLFVLMNNRFATGPRP